jgi:hypothetical protein
LWTFHNIFFSSFQAHFKSDSAWLVKVKVFFDQSSVNGTSIAIYPEEIFFFFEVKRCDFYLKFKDVEMKNQEAESG